MRYRWVNHHCLVGAATALPILLCVHLAEAQQLVEEFVDVTTLPANDWTLQNNSDPLGVGVWGQGNGAVFPAHSYTSDPSEYVAVNYTSGAGASVISNWLLTPVVELANGGTFSFWTRTIDDLDFPDRLQVRLSVADASVDVGTAATDVGDFSYLQLDINPTYRVDGYPFVWTEYVVTIADLPAGVQIGRIAFRYFADNGGPGGTQSDYIGVDLLTVDEMPVCGDFAVEGNETCDEGAVSTATCDADCTAPTCGDDFWNPWAGESCDDGNTDPDDGCSASCRAEILYDQLYDFGAGPSAQDWETASDAYDAEAADDFTIPTGATWSIETIIISGFQDSDGTAASVDVAIHADSSGLPGAAATSLAGGSCQYDGVVPVEDDGTFTITLPSACVLGEGTYWVSGQANQDFNPNGQWFWHGHIGSEGSEAVWRNPGDGFGTGCTTWAAITSCVTSSANLAFGLDGAPQSCGDGAIQSYLGEECDDGPSNSDSAADACRTTCADPSCGDGVVDTGEGCDDGTSNSDTEPGACRTDCAPANCGDGVVDADEECDDGTENSDTAADACRTTCVAAACGDGAIDAGEECDDGTDNSDTAADACRRDCVDAGCGDGVTDSGEECDDGTDNSDTEADACRTNCAAAACGDGVTDGGEECDDGNVVPGDGCDGACMAEGTGGAGGAGGTGTGGTGNLVTPPLVIDSPDEGCSCRVPGPDSRSRRAGWLALGLAGVFVARRRRR